MAKLPPWAKNILRGTDDPLSALSEVRRRLDPGIYSELIEWIPKIRYKNKGVSVIPYPTLLELKKQIPVLGTLDLSRELLWAANYFKKHLPKINGFIKEAHSLEASPMLGHFSKASTLLDNISREYGASLWWLETNLAFLQLASGLEVQKAYVKAVRAARGNDLLSVICFYLSQNNEDTTNPFRFRSRFAEESRSWNINEDFRRYLRYRVADDWILDSYTLSAILRFEASSSVIDYYETFMHVALRCIASSNGEFKKLFVPALQLLSESGSNDLRIAKALFLFDQDTCHLRNARIQDLALFDEAATGNTTIDLSRQLAMTHDHPSDMLLWNLIAVSATPGSTSDAGIGLGPQILSKLQMLLLKRKDANQTFLDCIRTSQRFRFLPFANALEAIACNQMSSAPLPDQHQATKAFLTSPYLSFNAARYLPPEVRQVYVQFLLTAYGHHHPAVVAEAQYGFLEGNPSSDVLQSSVGKNLINEIKAELAYERGEYEQAIMWCDAILQESKSAKSGGAARLKANCYLRLGDLAAACDMIAHEYIRDPGTIFTMPVRDCVYKLDKPERKTLAGLLPVPIVLDLFTRHFDDRRANIRAYSYEDFLLYHNIEKPSELAPILHKFERELLVYYLRNICTPEIMQVSTAFRGSRELEDERVAVCALLSQIDENNSKEYEEEIRDLTRLQAIRSGVRHVEQSKIFVDFTAIRRWAERNVTEGFNRYQALVKAGISVVPSAFKEPTLDFLLTSLANNLYELPKNEASDLLLKVVSNVLRECLTNPEHGLDCYLSMRIRHGTLSGQLRGPLEDEKLITQREGGSDLYKSNEHWLSRFAYLDPLILHRVDARLAEFSHEYDDVVDAFAKRFVQIFNHDTKKEGAFRVFVSTPRFILFANQIKPDTTFDEFLDLCFQLFWEATEFCLKSVRTLVDVQLKTEINRMLFSLQADIEAITFGTPMTELDSAIRTARIRLQPTLDQVKNWFRHAQSSSEPKFPFNVLLDIGLQCVKNIHREFDPLVSRKIGQLPEFIELTLFSDIFFIIFDNIRRHSGVSRPHVEITAEQFQDRLRISVTSEIASDVRTPQTLERVGNIHKAIAQGEYHKAVRSEGGTGLIKLRNITRLGKGSANLLDFGFAGDSFFVRLELVVHETRGADL